MEGRVEDLSEINNQPALGGSNESMMIDRY